MKYLYFVYHKEYNEVGKIICAKSPTHAKELFTEAKVYELHARRLGKVDTQLAYGVHFHANLDRE